MHLLNRRDRTAILPKILAALACVLSLVPSVSAIEPPILMRESDGQAADLAQGCALEPNLTGDCGNLRYYNLCSGYIWVFALGAAGEGAGVRYVVPGYANTVDIYIDADTNSDGCPDYSLFSDLDLDPALRWNCTSLGDVCVPLDASSVIVRTLSDGGIAPNFATDGALSETCDPLGTPRSFYYGINGHGCIPWGQLTGRNRDDNFLYWLIVDEGCPTTGVESATWGRIKGLYR